MDNKKECINVSVRIRPVLSQDNTSSSCLQTISTEPPVLVVPDRSQTYNFDHIFPEDADQQKVYDETVKPLVKYVKMGYNCTVFAYGQTGTGKTFTMGTNLQKPKNSLDEGIIPKALDQLFIDALVNSDNELDVYVSFSEIYNEKVFDLLQAQTNKAPLSISGFVVQGLSIKSVKNMEEARQLLELGNKNRHTGETKQNLNSSRSHAIFTVYYTVKNSNEEITGKLNLVDLAGSESVKKTGSRGSTFQEGISINKGLLSIGQVISALSTKSNYIPYRTSVITSILQGSLNSDNYISLIACVSSNPEDISETLQTLDFAQRAKKVRNNPEVNQVVAKYKKEHPGLFGSTRTPLKRSSNTPLKTPLVKKMVLPPLPLINESHLSAVDYSKSQFSVDMSSVSASTDITQQTLSPVIRKYMTKMEVSIMDRLETVIKSTLRRPTRASSSLLAEIADNKENTPRSPSVSWNKIQNEVSKLVKSEIAQMTAKTVRATSSPIEDSEKAKIRRILIYDSPENIDIPDPNKFAKEVSDDQVNFKVPAIPGKKINKARPPLSISPIENEVQPTSCRRSIRLSLKKINSNNSSLNMLDESFDTSNLSVLSDKNISRRDKIGVLNDSKTDIRACDFFNSQHKVQYQSPDDNDFEVCIKSVLNEQLVNDKHFGVSKLNSIHSRRSVRLAKKKIVTSPQYLKKKKNVRPSGAKTPSKILVERALKNQTSKDSPYTTHSKRVLTVLNKGTQKDLEKLYTIGSKTAEQILLFRSLKGTFKGIEDISQMPGWGGKKFDKFISQNFLRK